MNRVWYGNVGTCPCTSQCTLALLLCIVDRLDLTCVGWQVVYAAELLLYCFLVRGCSDLNLLSISLDWHGILAVLSPLGSYYRLDFSVVCGLYICVVTT